MFIKEHLIDLVPHLQYTLYGPYHLLHIPLKQILFRIMYNLRELFHLLIEEPIGTLLTVVDDCVGFAIGEVCRVLRLEHIEDLMGEGEEVDAGLGLAGHLGVHVRGDGLVYGFEGLVVCEGFAHQLYIFKWIGEK